MNYCMKLLVKVLSVAKELNRASSTLNTFFLWHKSSQFPSITNWNHHG